MSLVVDGGRVCAEVVAVRSEVVRWVSMLSVLELAASVGLLSNLRFDRFAPLANHVLSQRHLVSSAGDGHNSVATQLFIRFL